LGYNFYYNENRPHQSLNGKTPEMMVMGGQNKNIVFFKEKREKRKL